MQETACSPWAVLGLDEGASLAQVRRAFRQLAKTTHPDRGGSRHEFESVRSAFEQLCELARRDHDGDCDGGDAAPEPCRQPRHPVMPGTRPHARPAPAGVVRAYRWPAEGPAPRAGWAEPAFVARSARCPQPVSQSGAAFAAVLDAVLRQAGAAA